MKRRTFLALLLALLMALGSTALAEPFWKENHLSEEPVELTIAVERFSLDATPSYADKAFMKGLEEATNIKINWIEISQTNTTTLNAILASGELPDAFVGLITDSMITQNAALFRPLNDLLEENAPNTMAFYKEKAPYWESFMTFPDGNIYSLMGSFLPDYPYYLPGIMFINQAWLDNLGLQMPTTLDELDNVLVAFRDEDANGNGDPNDEIPLAFSNSHWNSNFLMLASSFGIPYSGSGETITRTNALYDIQDGKVLPVANTQAFRDFLTWTHKAAAEGLIDLEGFSQTEEQYFAKLDAGRCGLFWGWMPGTFMSSEELQNQYVAFRPVAAEGYKVRVGATQYTPNRISFVISASSEHPVEALKLWDYLSQSRESKLMVAYGPVGIRYKWNEEKQDYGLYMPTDEELTAAGYADYIGSTGTSKFSGSLGIINHHPVVEKVKWIDRVTQRDIGLNFMGEYVQEEFMKRGVVPASAQEEFDFATDGLTNMIFEFVASSTVNGITDETWDAYLQRLNTYGHDFYIDWYQKYFDGELK